MTRSSIIAVRAVLCGLALLELVGVAAARPLARRPRGGRKVEPAATLTSAPAASGATASAGPLIESSVQAAARAESVVVIDTAAIEAEVRRHRGHPLILHFWASWCGPCLVELPLVNQFAEQLRASGADLLSVSLDDPEKRSEHVLSLLQAQAPALTAAVARIDDPDRFIAVFHGLPGHPWEGSIPALFGFDRKGALVRQHVGEASVSDLAALARGAGVKMAPPPGARAAARKRRSR